MIQRLDRESSQNAHNGDLAVEPASNLPRLSMRY